MAVRILIRRRAGVLILDCDGHISDPSETIALRTAIQYQIEMGHTNLLINLSGASGMGLTAVAELIAGAYLASQQGGRLKAIGFKNAGLQYNELLAAVLMFTDEDTALKSFYLPAVAATSTQTVSPFC